MSSERSKLGVRGAGSARSLATSGVARRTASGERGGDALVINGSSSGIGGPNSGSSSRRGAAAAAAGGAGGGNSATAAIDVERTGAAGGGSATPNIRSRSGPTSDSGFARRFRSLAASTIDRSSKGVKLLVSPRIVRSGSGIGAFREKS
jgi:hypothetical protein